MLAYQHLKDFDQSIDWTVEMLSIGYETSSLLILAGISKPTFFLKRKNICALHSLSLILRCQKNRTQLLGTAKI